MHALLVSIGTDGDILPYVGIGLALRDRGHRVTLATSDDFRPLATAHGLDFHSLLSKEENHELLGHPDFWHPIKNARIAARWGVRFIRRQYEMLSELARDPDLFLVANPAVLAAGLVHETHGSPWTNLALQPWVVLSSIAPPVMPLFTFPKRTPRGLVQLFWRALDLMVDRMIGRELNAIRGSLKLPRARRILTNWYAKELVIGMFPDWYAPPQADWPSGLRLAGFPLFDGRKKAELPIGLHEFLQNPKPTICFTFGTGMMHASKLFTAAVEACQRLGVQGVFLTRHLPQLPNALPAHVRHFEFASFSALFPRCRAVVHHGGIGTVSQAFAAGTPQLILPFAFDQMDNAARVKKLGAGDSIKLAQVHGERLADSLTRIMTPERRASARQVAALFGGKQMALEDAADWIEELFRF